MYPRFSDDLRVAVLTSKDVFRKGYPILYVFHHQDDGMWEFTHGQETEESDYLIVSLEEVIALDNSVLQLADLPLGCHASGLNGNESWVRKNDGDEFPAIKDNL